MRSNQEVTNASAERNRQNYLMLFIKITAVITFASASVSHTLPDVLEANRCPPFGL